MPIYRQIVEQVKAVIASGLVAADDQLPSHRDLAKQLLVAPLTVKRAYDVLEQEGLVVTRRGLGTFVVGSGTPVRAQADAELEARVRALVRHGRALGLGQGELLEAVKIEWRAHRRKKERAR